ncbi:MAG: hypothetical protein HYV09_12980 [Deltaproteobacteria bacterium]|nr:hypothetical protein [Deltaproteobacteria bacterium]
MNAYGTMKRPAPTVTADFAEDLRSELLMRLRSEGYNVPGTELRDLVRWWCNIRRRRIQRRPRRLVRSRELQGRALNPEVARALRRIEKVVVEGRNLNPHLSRRRLDADFSDALFDMWSMHHLHLGPPGGREAPGTSELLFAFVTDDTFHAVDILDHKAFGARSLALILKRNWPHLIEAHACPQIHSLCDEQEPWTDEDRASAWAHGITTFISLDGVVYAPWGGGRTTAKTGARDTGSADVLLDIIARWQRQSRDTASLAQWVSRQTKRSVPPELRLRLQVRGDRLRVVEIVTGTQLIDALI